MGGQAIGIGETERDTAPPRGCGRRWVVGLGCERDAPPAEVIALAERAMRMLDAAAQEIICLASLDSRADAPAMQAAARHFGVPLRVFAADALERLTPRLVHPSEIVFAHTGCHGVAEGAALAAAGPFSMLAVAKIRSARATAAVAAVSGFGWGDR